ncbi:MAG: NUDIX hydrolase [Hyphomicrobiaceae bacterium]|nr:NUDIX hydrolase [Hyphomicrobiaceae bacterium]
MRPRTPPLTTDCVIFNADGDVLLIERGSEPFKGLLALPGGFVEIGETVEDACRREVLEETSIRIGRLVLVGVYSDPDRDPRGHTCSIAFMTHIGRRSTQAAHAKAGDDAARVAWVRRPLGEKLAFDHVRIIGNAMRLRDR